MYLFFVSRNMCASPDVHVTSTVTHHCVRGDVVHASVTAGSYNSPGRSSSPPPEAGLPPTQIWAEALRGDFKETFPLLY